MQLIARPVRMLQRRATVTISDLQGEDDIWVVFGKDLLVFLQAF